MAVFVCVWLVVVTLMVTPINSPRAMVMRLTMPRLRMSTVASVLKSIVPFEYVVITSSWKWKIFFGIIIVTAIAQPTANSNAIPVASLPNLNACKAESNRGRSIRY